MNNKNPAFSGLDRHLPATRNAVSPLHDRSSSPLNSRSRGADERDRQGPQLPMFEEKRFTERIRRRGQEGPISSPQSSEARKTLLPSIQRKGSLESITQPSVKAPKANSYADSYLKKKARGAAQRPNRLSDDLQCKSFDNSAGRYSKVKKTTEEQKLKQQPGSRIDKTVRIYQLPSKRKQRKSQHQQEEDPKLTEEVRQTHMKSQSVSHIHPQKPSRHSQAAMHYKVESDHMVSQQFTARRKEKPEIKKSVQLFPEVSKGQSEAKRTKGRTSAKVRGEEKMNSQLRVSQLNHSSGASDDKESNRTFRAVDLPGEKAASQLSKRIFELKSVRNSNQNSARLKQIGLSSQEVSMAAGGGPAAKMEPMEHALETPFDNTPETLVKQRKAFFEYDDSSNESPSLDRRRGSSSVFDDSHYLQKKILPNTDQAEKRKMQNPLGEYLSPIISDTQSKQSPATQKKKKMPAKQEQQQQAYQLREVQQAKRDREQNTVALFKRERDILRDWIRRQAKPLEKGVNRKQENAALWLSGSKDPKIPQTLAETYNLVCDRIVFMSNGRDTYFKRAALRKDGEGEGLWVENPSQNSNVFTVKWDYGDSSVDHSKLKPHQLFNHFPDTRELTTKQGLTKNLNSMLMGGGQVKEFFPRSYDLSDKAQIDLFIHDFNQTAILNVVLQHTELFLEIFDKVEGNLEIEKVITEGVSQMLEMEEQGIVAGRVKKQMAIRDKLSRMHFRVPSSSFEQAYWINTQLLEAALFYAQNLLNETAGVALQEKVAGNHDEFFKKNCFLPEYKFSSSSLESLQMYSSLEVPVNPERENLVCNQITTDQKIRQRQRAWMRLSKMKGWKSIFKASASNIGYLAFLTLKISKSLERYVPQYGPKSVDGSKNVWICKPSYNSRGFGIFCFNQKTDIINNFIKKSQAPKVVQKYIERPLLLKEGPRGEDLRKFDIRQWVLLTSIDPLQVYIYEDAYLRLCGAPYDINQIEDPQRHLSNYSIQKLLKNRQPMANQTMQTFDTIHEDDFQQDESRIFSQHQKFRQQQNPAEFVMSTEQFIKRLNNRRDYPEYSGREISWQGDFFPQIKKITERVFERMQEVMEHRPNSFELFGLDFVIDQNLKCWLIEANMSPAFSARPGQEWLTGMVDTMADGIVTIVEQKALRILASQKIPFQGPIEEKIKAIKTGKKVDTGGWVLFEQDYRTRKRKGPLAPDLQLKQQQQQDIGLEVFGFKANLKAERKLEKRWKRHHAAIFIQRVYRGFAIRLALQRQQEALERKKAQALDFACRLEPLLSFAQCRKDNEVGFSFQEIQRYSWEVRATNHIKAIELIQKRLREWLERKAQIKGEITIIENMHLDSPINKTMLQKQEEFVDASVNIDVSHEDGSFIRDAPNKEYQDASSEDETRRLASVFVPQGGPGFQSRSQSCMGDIQKMAPRQATDSYDRNPRPRSTSSAQRSTRNRKQ